MSRNRAPLAGFCIALLLAAGFMGLVSSLTRAQAPASDIIIEDADGSWTGTFEGSADLVGAARNVSPRVVAEYANSTFWLGLYSSDALNQVAGAVVPRVIAEYANSATWTTLASSDALDQVASAIVPRVIAEYVNSAFWVNLSRSDELDHVAGSVGPRIIVEYANSVFSPDLQRPSFLPSTTTPTPTPTPTPTSTPVPSVNNPPNQPTALSQFKSDGVTSIHFGGITTESTVVLKGNVSDPDGDQVRLQVELRQLDEYGGGFTGEPTQESVWVSSGSEASTPIYGLVSGNYHWRARAIDSNGATSPWVSAGDNPDSVFDFRVERLSISHIEVTQATQDENNGVPLIAGKPTFVRVYVDCGEGCTSLPNVTGELEISGPAGGISLLPINGPITAYHEDWTKQRGNLHRTLNFIVRTDLVTGTVTFTAVVSGVRHSETFLFQPAQRLRIAYVPIHYDPVGCIWPGPQDPDLVRIGTAHYWALRIYPTARIEHIRWPRVEWNIPFRRSLLCPGGGDPSDRERLLRALTLQWHLVSDEDRPHYVFGWLPDDAYGGGTSDPTWWPGGFGVSAFGDDDPQEGFKLFAHEIGHLMGRRHTNTVASLNDPNCLTSREGETDEERAYVDPRSDWLTRGHFTTSRIQDYGLNLGTVKDPNTTYDYMSYCGSLAERNVWTSSWTYEHIYSETLSIQTATLSARLLSTPQPYFLASGLVYTDDTAILDPIWAITSTVAAPESPPAGTQYCLEAQDGPGTVLASRCFDLTFVNYETGEATDVDGFNLMVPYPSGVARIVLKKGSTELAARTVSANAPIVNVTSPNGGESWSTSGSYTITWSASDADSDPLTYSVLYSPDERDWVPVGSVITDTQLTVNAGELAGSSSARIRVLATDGVNTSSDESDGTFTVGRKPPSVHILSPEGDVITPPDTPLWLQGYAYDLEDRTLQEDALQWSSSRDGELGMGSQVLVTLSPGQHRITLGATDSDGNTASASVNVYVGHKILLPLLLKN